MKYYILGFEIIVYNFIIQSAQIFDGRYDLFDDVSGLSLW